MASGLRHPDWYLISEQRFRRRAAVKETNQVFRGQPYIVLSDTITGMHMRLTERARQVWEHLDGRLTAHELWEELSRRPVGAPSQGEFVEWIMQLVSAGMVLSDHDLDPKHLSERSEKKRSAQIEQRAASPLAIKIKLFDPSWLIKVTYPFFAPLFTPIGGICLLVLIVVAAIFGIMNLPTLFATLDGEILSQTGLISLAIAYPILKALHELAHGYAVHKYGGEVRECGIMLLIFFPVPYMEASDSNAFPDKNARMLVGAAGIIAEISIAAASLLLWFYIEPGIERALLFNFMLIGSISTILFNGNPLLKFDAYYILTDWLEMPNLAQRSGQYLSDRFLSRTIGLRQEVQADEGEAPTLVIYGTLAALYRVFLTFTIAVIVSQIFFIVGVLLAVWSVTTSIIWPLAKTARRGWKMARTQNRMPRAMRRTVSFLISIGALLFLIPLPFFASGEGRIVLRQEANILAETSGSVVGLVPQNGNALVEGAPIMTLENSALKARSASLDLEVQTIESRLARAGLSLQDRRQSERELELATVAADDARQEIEELTIVAPKAGRLSWAGGQAPTEGRFVFRGERLGRVVAPDLIEIVLTFPAAYAGFLPENAIAELRLPDGRAFQEPIARFQVVDAGQQAPEVLLTSQGGPVPEIPDQPGAVLRAAWVGWIEPSAELQDAVGVGIMAKIDLPDATLAQQLGFAFRRLFLRAANF